MIKFVLGVLLGLGLGGTFFHYQVKKVDVYSFRIGYMAARVDVEGASILPVACKLYSRYNLANPPFGYTPGSYDQELKELCQNLPSNTIQLNPEQ